MPIKDPRAGALSSPSAMSSSPGIWRVISWRLMPATASRGTASTPAARSQAASKQYVAVAFGHSGGSIALNGSATLVIFGQ